MAHAIPPAAHAQGQDGHVERIAETAKLQEILLADTEIIPITGEMFLHHVERKCIVPRRDRRVRCEDTRGPNLIRGFLEGLSLLHEFTGTFEQHESGMAFIRMEDGRMNSQRAQYSYATHSEHDLLPDAMFLIAAIQSGSQFAVA